MQTRARGPAVAPNRRLQRTECSAPRSLEDLLGFNHSMSLPFGRRPPSIRGGPFRLCFDLARRVRFNRAVAKWRSISTSAAICPNAMSAMARSMPWVSSTSSGADGFRGHTPGNPMAHSYRPWGPPLYAQGHRKERHRQLRWTPIRVGKKSQSFWFLNP